jgi:hypothetical protein
MLALSIRQPWAWLIVNGWKDIENRTWSTKVRGRILVHAGKGMSPREYDDAYDFATGQGRLDLELLPTYDDLAKQRGGIVGSVDIVDCVRQSDSRWFVGDFGFVLRDAQVWPFMPCTGKLGFFEVDPRPVAVVPAWSA